MTKDTGGSIETDNCNIPFFYLILFLLFSSPIYRAVKHVKIQIIMMQKLGHLTDQILKICKRLRKQRYRQHWRIYLELSRHFYPSRHILLISLRQNTIFVIKLLFGCFHFVQLFSILNILYEIQTSSDFLKHIYQKIYRLRTISNKTSTVHVRSPPASLDLVLASADVMCAKGKDLRQKSIMNKIRTKDL